MEILSYSGKGSERKLAKGELKTIKDFKDAHEADPNDTEVTWKYGEKLCEIGDYKTAKPILESLTTVTLSDSTAEIWKFLYLGRCWERAYNTGKAIENYKKAIDTGFLTTGNRKAMAYTRLAELCFHERQYEESIKYIQLMPKEQEGNMLDYWWLNILQRHLYLPLAYAKIGQEIKGKNAIKEILTEFYTNKNIMMLAAFGQLCIINEQFIEEALPWAKKAAELSEWKNGYPLITYASLAGLNREYEEAIRTWNVLLALPEKSINVRERERIQASANLAALYMKTGDIEKSDKSFQLLLNDTQNNKDNLFLLAYTCYQHKIKLQEALGWAKQVIELTEEDYRGLAMYLNLYANLLFENGEIQKAIEAGTEAYEKSKYYRFRDDLERYKEALK